MTPQTSIRPCELPQSALLRKYLYAGAYTDCYVTDIPRAISQPEYIEAFYTTAVFKAERLLLKWLISRPSTDSEAKLLAAGALSSFAAWRVEGRAANQLLLSDISGRTKSWLMIAPLHNGGDDSNSTRLYFGSAVIPAISGKSRKRTLGFTFRSLLGFHKLYSRILLFAARSRLARAATV